MRVLHVISDENVGGAGVLLTSLLKHFDQSKIESVVALPKNSALTKRIEKYASRVVYLEHRIDRFSSGGICEVKKLIKKRSPDLVHSNAALASRIAARLCGVPVIFTRHCAFPPSGIWENRLLRMLGGACNASLSDAVIATAEAAKRDLLQMGIPERKIHVILNGSEAIRALSDAELYSVRKKWGIEESDF